MTGIPFPRPMNANEARGNMLYWADKAEALVQAGGVVSVGMAAIEKAKMWAAIALTLPEVETVELLADDRPIASYQDPLRAPTAELEPWPAQRDDAPLERVPLNDPTERVPSHVYDVLRALAARYVRSSLSKTATVTDDDLGKLEDMTLRLHDNEDGSTLVTLEG